MELLHHYLQWTMQASRSFETILEVMKIGPHNSALVAVPCTSGPTEALSISDAGLQFFRK
jgi:hypothetical protein